MGDFFQKLQKSLTFDERGRIDEEGMEGQFQRMRKANSFGQNKSPGLTRTSSMGSDVSEKLSLPDVMHRRYFGMESDEAGSVIPLMSKNIKLNTNEQVSTSLGDRQKCVAVVDTFSTGAMLSFMLYKKGYKVICILSGDLTDLLDMIPEGLDFTFEATIKFNTSIDSNTAIQGVINELNMLKYPVIAILPGAETGVELADQLSERMGLRTNGTALSEARRNKYVMGETIRNAGIRAVKQLQASTWGEIAAFLEEWKPDPFKAIVKPVDSAGSDDVTLCKSFSDVQMAFGNIMGKVNGLGIVNKAVLVQEFLEGQEYVVDSVSKDGVHKVLAIWAYDRRAANGGGFVCFGQKLLTLADDPCCEAIVEYQKKVLTALGILNGPAHGEVKWFKGEPVLVEVGARCHGGDGLWCAIADEVYGCNQAAGSVTLYTNPDAFDELPALPITRNAYGAIKWLINHKPKGVLKCNPPAAVAELKAVTSYRGHQFFVQPGDKIIPTKNCFSWAGCACLANPNFDLIEADYARVEQLEGTDLFDVEPDIVSVELPLANKFVAIVDPFSTGALLASLLNKKGVLVVAVYSANISKLEKVKNLVPRGLTLSFASSVSFSGDVDSTVQNLLSNARASFENAESVDCIAVLAGAETGVELADQLSERMGLRTNGTALSEARRNKYVMGETIRNAGIRAVKQRQASTWGEIAAFLEEWKPDPFKVVMKPVDSAGSDDVLLLTSVAEVRVAFEKIMGKVNSLGIFNASVLIQEFLEGPEYAIDSVSEDGVHKIVAIWMYDRRKLNGVDFVCFGETALTLADDPSLISIAEYQLKVLTAVGIVNGPAHGEVKWVKGEPVLVEVGARCHGAEGSWMDTAEAVYGYNQAKCSLDAYLDPRAFAVIPALPYKRNGFGRTIFIVVKVQGILKGLNESFLLEIEEMQSVIGYEIFLDVGSHIKPTSDCFDFGGVVKLAHVSSDIVEKDHDRIREMEDCGLFVV